MNTNKIVKTLKTYFKKVAYVDFAILYGSFASGKSNAMSDIDIAIHCSKDVSLLELGSHVSKLESLLKKAVDLIILNDLYRKNPSMSHKIISNGILIFERNRETYICFKKNTFLFFLDTKFLREKVNSEFNDRLKKGQFAVER